VTVPRGARTHPDGSYAGSDGQDRASARGGDTSPGSVATRSSSPVPIARPGAPSLTTT